MHTTNERVIRVKKVIKEHNRKRECLLITGLSALSVMLFSSIWVVFALISDGGIHGGVVQGLFGATMMFDNIGGYVLVGILTFIAAVALTLFCVRHKEKAKETKKIGDTKLNK